MTIDEALAHIGAYIEGGDELGVIGENEAADAYDVIRGELADLRRQLVECQAQAEEAQRESYRRGADADRAVADARRERDAARAEGAELRRQLARTGYEYREVQRALVEVGTAANADDPTSPEAIIDAIADLRRQLTECQAEAARLRAQVSRLQDEVFLLRGDTAKGE